MHGRSSDRFFLYGYYGQGNLGDDLLMTAVIRGICEIRPHASFTVRNQYPIAGLEVFNAPIKLTDIDSILADQSKAKISRAVETLFAYRRHFRDCSWFVFGGGTLFHERQSAAPLVLMVAICLLGRMMGLRIVALGVGVAELKSRLARAALRTIISMSALFAVRDDAAYAECKRAGANRGVVLTGDLVFNLTSLLTADEQNLSPNSVSRRIGLSINPGSFCGGNPKTLEMFKEAVSMLAARGWYVSLLAFHESPGMVRTCQDQTMLAEIADGMPPDRRALVTEYTLSADPANLKTAFSSLDLHCGMRFHGHVLAAIYRRPFVGVSADNKIESICKFFGMPMLPFGRFSAQSLVDAIDDALRLGIDEELLDSSVAGARQNFTELRRLLKSDHRHVA